MHLRIYYKDRLKHEDYSGLWTFVITLFFSYKLSANIEWSINSRLKQSNTYIECLHSCFMMTSSLYSCVNILPICFTFFVAFEPMQLL